VDDERTDPDPAGRTAGLLRDNSGYPPGWLVRYRCRCHAGRARPSAPVWREHVGTVAGHSLRDEHTSTTWVPVRPRGSATDVPVCLVRATDILGADPPAPDFAAARPGR
jgi:hypothetical protein